MVLEVHIYENQYQHCGESWSDVWCSTCNDECPVCGGEIEPESSEILSTQSLRQNFDRCDACSDTHDF